MLHYCVGMALFISEGALIGIAQKSDIFQNGVLTTDTW
jgi:hypothetical protein